MATKQAVAKPAKKTVVKKVATKSVKKKPVQKKIVTTDELDVYNEERLVTKHDKKSAKKSKYPVIIVGSHSVRTEHENGRVDFVVDDEKLKQDVLAALAEFEATKVVKKKKAK
jgi:hypothetical protein